MCSPFKNYLERLNHNAITRNNGKTLKLPKVKLDFARRSFYFLGASIFNSTVKFKKTLTQEFYLGKR